MNPVHHVAIIMDRNGRWGLKHKNSRNAGHKAGLNTVEKIIKETIKNNIQFLTLYAFSTEHWKRPKYEINFLFNLLENFLIMQSLEDTLRMTTQHPNLRMSSILKFRTTTIISILNK